MLSNKSGKKSEIGLLTEQVGRVIFRLRKKKNLTLKHMRQKTGLSVRLLDRVERGLWKIHIKTLLQIARALDVPLSALIQPGEG